VYVCREAPTSPRKTAAVSPASNREVTASGFFYSLAAAVGLSATLSAAPQPPPANLPVSVDRVREELTKRPTPGLKLDTAIEPPKPVFKSGVEQELFVLPFEQWLEKEFELRGLQKQSAEWGAKCCGIDLGILFKGIEDAMDRRKVRKIRSQIKRELAELEAARKKAGVTPSR
jgi:hypothetical protein